MRLLSFFVVLGMACAATPPPPVVAPPTADTRVAEPTLEERLGYPRGSRLLILHFDDLGLARSANRAAVAAREAGLKVSASVIVPGPRFQEIAAYARAHPDFDLGIHLALTSEWPGHRWGPVAPKPSVPTLLAPDSLFRHEWVDTTTVRWQEVELELQAQIGTARANGIQPTHLDVHSFVLFTRGPILYEILTRVARDERLPVLSAREWIVGRQQMRRLPSAGIVLARVVAIGPDVPPSEWSAYYADQLRALPPGVSELILHPALDSRELRAVTAGRVNWGAAWRVRDWAFVSSRQFRRLLRDEKIHLITWRELTTALAKQ
ncbi:MAG: ChbG/HpnK family deacetylase [Gemmatimonadales bacterium]